jgi:hypothetical protein
MLRTRKQAIPLAMVAALSAGLGTTAVASTATSAATSRIVSLKVAPTKVRVNKNITVTWELARTARTTFQVARCQNSTCTSRTKVGAAIRRSGATGLNSLKLQARLSPARYAVVATAGRNTRKALFRVVK